MTTPSRLLSADREREAERALSDWRDMDAEWRRLRRIEAAARDVDNLAPAVPVMGGDWSDDAIAALIDLRAALPQPGEPE